MVGVLFIARENILWLGKKISPWQPPVADQSDWAVKMFKFN